MYLNNNLSYINNFFCINRLESNVLLIDTQEPVSFISSTENNGIYLKDQSVFNCSTTIITNVNPLFKKADL